MKKIIGLLLMFLVMLSGCESCGVDYDVYFYNFKPESVEAYEKTIKAFEEETGIKVRMSTAASGQYESSLQSEMLKSSQPTLFQINGPVGYQNWKEYTLELSDTSSLGYEDLKLYDALTNKEMVVSEDGKIYGLPIAFEGYGLVYNELVFNEYFALSNRQVQVNSMDEIDSFDDLRLVVEDLTSLINDKSKLPETSTNIRALDGVFVSTSMKTGAEWPYTTHLLNIPMFYEFYQEGTDAISNGLALNEIEFTYQENFKNIFDLYLNNSVTNKANIGDKSYDDSVTEFALGKAAIIQQGNWVEGNIISTSGSVINSENIKMMPIYTGIENEDEYSISIGTENYWCINKNASKEQINATITFMNWLFTGNGRTFVTNDLAFIAPYDTFDVNDYPNNSLTSEVLKYYNGDKKVISWSFSSFPSEQFKTDVASSLLQYAQNKISWDAVINNIKESWKREKS